MIRLLIAAAMVGAVIYSTVADAAQKKTVAAFASYDAAKDAALAQYEKAASEAWQAYAAKRNAASADHAALVQSALSKFCLASPETCTQWQEAAKAGDIARALELERTVPEIAEYIDAARLAFDEHQKADKDAFDQYEADTAKAFEALNRAVERAHAAIQARR